MGLTEETPAPDHLGEPVLAETDSGTVRGIWRRGSAAFLGVPFAEPPVGPLRFAAPVRARAWTGVRDATRYGPTPQRRPFAETTTIPEPSLPGSQTLNVNVFTPAPGDPSAKLPVLVWIHGGGFFAGSPASPWYDGRAFNRDGAVTVTLSYRLGFDGFGWIDDAPANRGLLDQIAALEWVKRNIAQFGGDPERVTIAGQSAGGGSVLALMSSPLADGLFTAAISQSGALSRLRPDQAKAAAGQLAQLLGLETNGLRSWLGVNEDSLLDAERALTFERMFAKRPSPEAPIHQLADTRAHTLDLAFAPVVDGESVLDFEERILSGAHRDLPLLLGTTLNEFMTPDDSLAPREAISAGLESVGASQGGVEDFWAEADRLGPAYVRSQLMAMGTFRVPAASIAGTRIRAGSGSRTWLYDFRYRSHAENAAVHCGELPFVWDLGETDGVVEALGSRPSEPLAREMHSDWMTFLATGTSPWSPVAACASGAKVYGEPTQYSEHAYRLEQEIMARSSS